MYFDYKLLIWFILLELLKELDTLSYDLILKEVKKFKSEYELFQKMVNRRNFKPKTISVSIKINIYSLSVK